MSPDVFGRSERHGKTWKINHYFLLRDILFQVILGQHQSIDSSHLWESRDFIELLPVSPSDSFREEVFSSFDAASGESHFYECQFAKEYLIENQFSRYTCIPFQLHVAVS